MRRLVAISIVAALIALVLHPVGPYLEYALNRDFIANNYCVNEDRPELNCKGSCYLMKRLRSQTQDQGKGKVLSGKIHSEVQVIIPGAFRWDHTALLTGTIPDLWPLCYQSWVGPPIHPPPRRA